VHLPEMQTTAIAKLTQDRPPRTQRPSVQGGRPFRHDQGTT
jgi:hypothetical protein